MNRYVAELIEELRSLIADLGKDGGVISPSVYDTARVLCLHPPVEGVEPGLEWLLMQQQPDGGWGDTVVPTSRDVPTLATILALQKYRPDRGTRAAMADALDFLNRSAEQWLDVDIDAVPIATEMILPYLLAEASRAGLMIAREPYARLYEMRARKMHHLARMKIRAGSAPTFSWETFGSRPVLDLLDAPGGVGHSPAATATWLRLACSGRPKLARAELAAENYLKRAQAATKTGIPGVVPVVYPISAFELSYGLYALTITGLLSHAYFEDVVSEQGALLMKWVGDLGGLGFSEFFMTDADGTSVALAALKQMGYAVSREALVQFEKDEYFVTFPHELNPSILSNAHVIHTLGLLGHRHESTERFLLQRQLEQGYWLPDKWHSSRYYSTMEATIALDKLGHRGAVDRARHALVMDQHVDGGWGAGRPSSVLDTCYGALILCGTQGIGKPIGYDERNAVNQAHAWLMEQLEDNRGQPEKLWTGKELYRPHRVDRMFELSTMLKLTTENMSVEEWNLNLVSV